MVLDFVYVQGWIVMCWLFLSPRMHRSRFLVLGDDFFIRLGVLWLHDQWKILFAPEDWPRAPFRVLIVSTEEDFADAKKMESVFSFLYIFHVFFVNKICVLK